MQNGSDNKDLAAVFDALAVVKMRQNELQNAEKYLLDGLRQKIMLVGPGSPHLLPNLDYLAQVYRARGEFGLAEQQLKKLGDPSELFWYRKQGCRIQ